jgi:L,D-peptidoglycan transpeptidase YkuD (ErfK/YbiS/YcfS/YnhG family)
MDLIVTGNGEARWGKHLFRCALGRAGVSAEKREGDGATPAGRFAMRYLLYRPDRLEPPATGLGMLALSPGQGWCDDPADALYNRPVRLPYAARHEKLWRADRLYDLVVVLGHNDDPVRPGLGSAIFLHVGQPDYAPTTGCVVLAESDLLALLSTAGPGDAVEVRL